MYILICLGRFRLVERLFGLVFYSGHAFESANSSQRVIIGVAMYDTFNTWAHGGMTPQLNENIDCQCRGLNHGYPD